jgi:hypothetical protein
MKQIHMRRGDTATMFSRKATQIIFTEYLNNLQKQIDQFFEQSTKYNYHEVKLYDKTIPVYFYHSVYKGNIANLTTLPIRLSDDIPFVNAYKKLQSKQIKVSSFLSALFLLAKAEKFHVYQALPEIFFTVGIAERYSESLSSIQQNKLKALYERYPEALDIINNTLTYHLLKEM